MFLTKKNGGLTVKPKEKPKNQKALGGWDDEEDQVEPNISKNSSKTV